MILAQLATRPAPRRCIIARCTPVFTEAEWEAASKTASRLLAVIEDAETVSSTSDQSEGSSAVESNGRQTFSDAQWEEAIKQAPLLLAELQRIEEGADAETPDVTDAQTDASTGGKVSEKMFTPEQWDSAIRIAIASEEALAKKMATSGSLIFGARTGADFRTMEEAEIDESINAMKMEAEALAPPPTGPTVSDVMAFSGSAPELVNGRVAMLGFVSATAAELAQGESVASQFSAAQAPVLLTVAVFVVASLIPLFRDLEGRSVGPFTSEAERLNGRAAMIGMAALILLEATRQGTPLF